MKAKDFDVTRTFSIVAGLALATLLSGCGGSSTPTQQPTPTPTPTPTPPVVVAQGGGPVRSGFIAKVTPLITTTQAGTLDFTVDWTFASNDIDVAVTRGDCSFDDLANGRCNVAGFSISATAKPERVRVTGAAAGTYALFIENTGATDDSVSFQVVLSPGASSASQSSPPTLELPEKMRHPRGRETW